MVDGSDLPFKENISYTKSIAEVAHTKNMVVEAELGRLSGTEDDLTVEDYEARLTDVTQVLYLSNTLLFLTEELSEIRKISLSFNYQCDLKYLVNFRQTSSLTQRV